LEPLGSAGALVEEHPGLAEGRRGRLVLAPGRLGRLGHDRSQKLGPMGSAKSPCATKYPSAFTVIASWGRCRAAGPKSTRPPSARSNVDWWHGQSMWWVCCS